MRKSKWLLFMAAILMMFVVVGCGGTETSNGGDNSSDSSNSGEEKATGGGEEVVDIGIVLGTTGPIATTGQWTLDGHRLAADQINNNGGFKVGDTTYKVNLIHYDSGGKAESATSSTERLINQDKVPVVIGTSLSSETAAMIPIAEREKTPLMTFVAASDVLTAQGASFFSHAAPANINYTDSGTKTLLDMGIKNVAMIYVDDAWGQSYAKLYPPKIEEAGIKIVSVEAFAKEQKDFAMLLNKVKATNPDGILLAAETELAIPLLKQLHQAMPDVKILETGGLVLEEALRLAPEISEGLVALSRAGEETDEIRAFKELLKTELDYEANSFNYSGWDAIHFIVDAMQRAGTVTDKEKLNEAIRGASFEGLIGVYAFNEKGENSLIGNRAIIKNGEVIYQTVDSQLP